MSITQKYKEKDGDSPEEGSEQESAGQDSGEAGEEAEAAAARPMGLGARRADEEIVKAGAAEASDEEGDEEDEEDDGSPAQLGTKRFVYAAYFGGGIAVAFLLSKILEVGWYRLSQYKPEWVGEPKEEVVMAISGAVGIAAAIYYWNRTRARQLIEEVADELSKVTWPSKQEVTNSTAVVLVTTALATVFFALMDRFWGFVTNLVYGS